MADWKKSWRLLILFSLLSLTELLQVRDEEWKELSPDIAALHQLRGLSDHMFHENIRNPPNHKPLVMDLVLIPLHREDIDQNPMSLLSDLQENEKFTASVIQKEQDFEGFLAAVDEQKTQGVLLVSNECLFNVSCVPEADSYTLVKIFGSVSEDEQTVSGLSGSSLAELMLKPSLETAPVFSLDGNTTKDFQHNFIRVFTARGIPAVLETNQENHQTYQVMNRLREVSGYQIPQRPVDHSTQYDHQQILILEDDPVVRTAATYLFEKHPKVSSVYVLDNNQRPVLIRGDSVPLTKDSRLVLVGHGRKDNSGEMRLGGYEVQEVSKIIQQTSRDSNKIKTISVVACDVGSDNAFIETLLKDLHETAGMETELHLRNTVLQILHTGEKITLEITKDGEQWRHEDDSKKVVATLDRNGDVIIRNEPGSKGKEIVTAERNFLGPKKNDPVKQSGKGQSTAEKKTSQDHIAYRKHWPIAPKRFINQNVYDNFNANDKKACDELEAMSWGFFHNENIPSPVKLDFEAHIAEYYLTKEVKEGEKIKAVQIKDQNEKQVILSKCYQVQSGEDVRNVIRHYAKTGEDEVTYLKVNDWILKINPDNLYVSLVGKRLDNTRGETEEKVKPCIEAQTGKESYKDIRGGIKKELGNSDPRKKYVQYVKDFLYVDKEYSRYTNYLPLPTEAWLTTYFTASVISESARNFRTFPLILMALDMVQRDDIIKEKGLNFLWEEHSMAGGGSWIDTSKRGFSGSADYENSINLVTQKPSASSEVNNKPKDKKKQLEELLKIEIKLYQSYSEFMPQREENINVFNIAEKYGMIQHNSVVDYETFKNKVNNNPQASGSRPKT